MVLVGTSALGRDYCKMSRPGDSWKGRQALVKGILGGDPINTLERKSLQYPQRKKRAYKGGERGRKISIRRRLF